LCQRYLPAWNVSVANAPLGQGQAYSTTSAYINLPFKVSTRVPVTGITTTAASSFYTTNATYGVAGTFATISFAYSSTESMLVNITATLGGFVAGNTTTLAANTTPTQILGTGCEL
jgi:hypothetical protein